MNNKKLRLVTILLLSLVTLTAMAFALVERPADLLVSAANRLESAQSAYAVVSFEADVPEQSGSGTVELWGQLDYGPNGEPAFRAEVLSSSIDGMDGTTAVSDGTQFWLYNPGENKVITGTFAEMYAQMAARAEAGDFDFDHEAPELEAPALPEHPQNAEDAVAMLLEYFNAERGRRTQIGNNDTVTVRLVPIPEQMPDEVRAAGGLINVWLRLDDNAPIGAEYTGGALGSVKAVATTLELDIDIDPSTFTFELPAGAEVVPYAELEARAAAAAEAATPEFDLLTPAELPAGAALLETTAVRTVVVQRYSLDDGRSFTVTQGHGDTPAPDGSTLQTVTVRGVEASLYSGDSDSRTLLTWSENDVTYWIGGDLTAEQAIAIAEGLQ